MKRLRPPRRDQRRARTLDPAVRRRGDAARARARRRAGCRQAGMAVAPRQHRQPSRAIRGRRAGTRRPSSWARTSTRSATRASTTGRSGSWWRSPPCSACTIAAERLPFAIEVIAFADEEGLRFGSTYLGSRARGRHASTPPTSTGRSRDGVTHGRRPSAPSAAIPSRIADDRWHGGDLLGYVEVHIEQGPVLEGAWPAGRRRDGDRRPGSLPGHLHGCRLGTPARCR